MHVRKEQESVHLPALEMAIEGVLADGVITPKEAAYVRDMGANLGISGETVERLFTAKARESGVSVPDDTESSVDPDSDDPETTLTDIPAVRPRRKRKAAPTHAWWDATFSSMLLDAIPEGGGVLLDVYCRNAWSALTVLPQRPEMRYVGLDRNPERLEMATQSISRLGERAALYEGYPQQLPLDDEAVDIVLAMRALQNQPDTTPIFSEAVRVLSPGGRFIAVEPDGLAEQFYFDGHLGDYNAAVHGLFQVIDEAMGRRDASVPEEGQPGLALGPALPARMAAAGLQVSSVRVHASTNLKPMTAKRLMKRLRSYPRAMARASGLAEENPALKAVYAAVDRLEAELPPDQKGMGGNLLPLFMAVGIKT